MTMPTWWSERRFGVFVHATVASVPAWAPIGQHAECYQRHLGEVDDASGRPGPLVEVLAHHRDRWGHVERYDDFVPLLTFERFDADEWARLVSDAGAGYSVAVARHHDGWTWWDAPETSRPLTEDGPRRDVVAEYADACRRHDVALGTYYSFLDWGDTDGPDDRRDEVRSAQALDLVERLGSVMLWGDVGCGRDPDDRTSRLLERLRAIDPQLVVNDRWIAPSAAGTDVPPVVRTFEWAPPEEITDGPWELSTALGHSCGYNRAERTEHLRTGPDIVALYTEVLAKGGNLLLHVGPDADGSIPPRLAEPLRRAGRWIHRFGPLLASSTPWTRWGDADTRYLHDDGDVIVVDVARTGTFTALTNAEVAVTAVERVDAGDDRDLAWHQDGDGLHVTSFASASRHAPDAGDVDVDVDVYRISVDAPDRPDELFAPEDPAPISLAPLLADARPGDIVQLGDGVYAGPAAVPDGVVLRGLGPDRTTITRSDHDEHAPDRGATDTGGPTLSVGAHARLEHVRVIGPFEPASTHDGVVSLTAGDATLLGCTIGGTIDVNADDVLLRAVTARRLRARNSDRLHVSRCDFTGGPRDVGIELRGGGGHHVESNRLSGHLCSVRVSETTGTTIRGNTLSGRWWAIHLDHCESAHVHGNRISRTMRAVDIDGGTQAVVDGNAVTDGDSGCVVEDGASDCEVYGNHWDRCRIGLLAWDAVSLHHQDNVASGLHEPENAFVTGP